MAQLMPLPLIVSCVSKIQIGFTFLVPAHLGSPGKRAIKRVCVCVCSIFISAAPSPCHPYLEQVKHVASRECSSKVNILQDKPATRLLAVSQCLPDLSQMTLVVFHSKCNGSHSTFHTNLPGKLLHHADWIPEQLAYDIHTCTLFNGYSQEELS